ncbi:MAG: aminodeoxychorismate/anthranilate synthase component II [Candidatus Eremiobacteraeota bacterium]|nr:aminodeoxychorismate/anthranilate synthase component II [Candidatus Eremiobacteraeota bacterium]
MKKILFIDNFDSFTYNLVDEFEKRRCLVKIYRNNLAMDEYEALFREFSPDLLVFSPGPSAPRDAGCSIDLIKTYAGKVPMFGVCLGLQCMIEAFGGKVGHAGEIVHGKTSLITHDGKGIFSGLPSPLPVGRYHSLAGLEIPLVLEVAARKKDIVMAVRHQSLPVTGVQFHPESILTAAGGAIIDNVLSGREG